MSYNRRKHIKNKIHRTKPKKSVFKKLWFWVLLLVFLILSAGIYFAIFYQGVQIKNIVISGTERVNLKELEKFISENTGTKFSRSILLCDTKSLEKKVLQSFFAIENVKINKKYFQTLNVQVFERTPVGDYCSNSGQCFLIDGNGVAFEKIFTTEGGGTIIRQENESSEIAIGKNILEKNIIESIYKIQKNLKDNLKINLKEAFLSSPIRINVKTSEGWEIYFDAGQGASVDFQLKKLNLLFSGEISENRRQNLRYIDLRPSDRAIICDNSECGG